MTLRVPGTQRRIAVTPIRIVALTLLVPLVWAGYLLFGLWQFDRYNVKPISQSASSELAPDPPSTPPVIIYSTPTTGKPTASASPTSGAATTAGGASTGAVASPATPERITASTTPPATGATAAPIIPTGAVRPPEGTVAPSPITDWKGHTRINILLVGLDKRPDEDIGRTDTIMLASLDFQTNRAYVLSIPRDLLVNIYGEGFDYDYYKINAAYPLGENPKHKPRVGSGMDLLIKTLRARFNIDIHEYGLINFQGFVSGVDALGGIDIYVPKKIVDTEYPNGYKYSTVVFEQGWQHMDGETALKYARTRHVGGDFARIKRQQQVLTAVQQKARSPGLILKAPTLLNVVKGNFVTSLTLSDQIQLAKWGAGLPKENVQFFSLTGREGINPETDEYVLVPDAAEVTAILHQVFGPTSTYVP